MLFLENVACCIINEYGKGTAEFSACCGHYQNLRAVLVAKGLAIQEFHLLRWQPDSDHSSFFLYVGLWFQINLQPDTGTLVAGISFCRTHDKESVPGWAPCFLIMGFRV